MDAFVPGFHTCRQNLVALEGKTLPTPDHSGCVGIYAMGRSPMDLSLFVSHSTGNSGSLQKSTGFPGNTATSWVALLCESTSL